MGEGLGNEWRKRGNRREGREDTPQLEQHSLAAGRMDFQTSDWSDFESETIYL